MVSLTVRSRLWTKTHSNNPKPLRRSTLKYPPSTHKHMPQPGMSRSPDSHNHRALTIIRLPRSPASHPPVLAPRTLYKSPHTSPPYCFYRQQEQYTSRKIIFNIFTALVVFYAILDEYSSPSVPSLSLSPTNTQHAHPKLLQQHHPQSAAMLPITTHHQRCTPSSPHRC